METYTWKLTKEQASTLVGIVDVAIKAGGLQVAEKALPLVSDMTSQFNEQIQNAKPEH